MSMPSVPVFHLSLVTLLTVSALSGACSSSGDGNAVSSNEATGGNPAVTPTVTPESVTPAVGSGGSPSDVTGETTSFGFVQIDQPSDGDGGSAFAGFYRADLPIPAGQAIASFVPPVDTCTVTRLESSTVVLPDEIDLDFDLSSETVSAGETITFTSSAGTWLTLLRQERTLPGQEAPGLVVYSDDDGLPQPIPTGLMVDIPGDAFPAFSNVPVPDVTPLAGVIPVGTPATADTTFRWQAGSGDPSVFVEISIFSFGGITLPDGLPQDLLDSLPEGGIPGLGDGGPSVLLDCIARDDGEFSLPAATRAELDAEFSGMPSYSRIGITAVQRGSALLLVSSSSSSD